MCLQNKCFEMAVGKEEIAGNNQFLRFVQHFILFWRNFCCIHQIKIVLSKHLQFAKVLEQFVVWERLKSRLCGKKLRLFAHQLLQITSIDTRYRSVMHLELDDDSYLTSCLIKKSYPTTKNNYN